MGEEDNMIFPDRRVTISLPRSLLIVAELLADTPEYDGVAQVFEEKLIPGLRDELRTIGRERFLAAIDYEHERNVGFWNGVFDELEASSKTDAETT